MGSVYRRHSHFVTYGGIVTEILDNIVAILTVASCLSAAFNYVVIRPLQKAIDMNSDVLSELKKEIEASAADRRSLDARMAALEEAHRINKERITRIEELCQHLKIN